MNEPPSTYPREELVRALMAVGEEDRHAFSLLYSLTSGKLFGICLRICGERQAAEDVLQDVYVTIWKRAGAYEPGRGSPMTWLATIARNRALDVRRAQARRPVTQDGEAPDPVDAAPLASEMMLLDEEERKLWKCLEQLAETQQHAIRTAFLDGLTYSELADRTGVPLGTMKSRIKRGLSRLRECLNDDA